MSILRILDFYALVSYIFVIFFSLLFSVFFLIFWKLMFYKYQQMQNDLHSLDIYAGK